MKTKQFLAAIFVIATLSIGSVFASENTSAVRAKQNLSKQIEKAFNTTPFEDLMKLRDEKITVLFKVNQNHEFELIQVIGKNRELVNYSTRILSKKTILVDSSIEPNAYFVPMRFVTE
jgi:hypothetical protein